MALLIAALICIIGFGVTALAVWSWVCRESYHAHKYRQIVRFEDFKRRYPDHTPATLLAAPAKPSWTITYRDRGRVRTKDFLGNTEGEVLVNFLKETRIRPNLILTMEQKKTK